VQISLSGDKITEPTSTNLVTIWVDFSYTGVVQGFMSKLSFYFSRSIESIFGKKSFGTWRKLVDNRREIFERRRKKGNFLANPINGQR
jgi:hypothetical protein